MQGTPYFKEVRVLDTTHRGAATAKADDVRTWVAGASAEA